MSIEQEQKWITGEEFGRERRRLIQEHVPDDDPRFRELYHQIEARDEFLYERYGKQYFDSHYGQWIAISLDGEVLFAERLVEILKASRERFGPANAAIRRLNEAQGLAIYH
jgi:hypothetical protein